jgi:2-methylisocitrate lyase-like PEP mutase family enzyme
MNPSQQRKHYEAFLELHQQPGCFIMPNAWDGLTASMCAASGFKSIGSSSIAIAWAMGRLDGYHAVSRVDAIANASLMSQLSGLPVNGDLEDGFGPSPHDCVATVEAAIAGGLGGLGIEDTTADPAHPLHDFDTAVARIKASVAAAKGKILLTARTDNYLNGHPDLDDTIKRLVAFAELGADVLYAPGLPDVASIVAVVKAVAPKPVNVVVGPGGKAVPLAELQALGVKRVSLGGALYRQAMGATLQALQSAAKGDVPAALKDAVPTKELNRIMLANQAK